MTERPGYGDVLYSSTSDARFLVLETGTAEGMPQVNGVAMVRGERQPCSAAVPADDHCDLRGGRRYTDGVTGLRLMCIWPGQGALQYDDRPMVVEQTPLAMFATARQASGASARDEAGDRFPADLVRRPA